MLRLDGFFIRVRCLMIMTSECEVSMVINKEKGVPKFIRGKKSDICGIRPRMSSCQYDLFRLV